MTVAAWAQPSGSNKQLLPHTDHRPSRRVGGERCCEEGPLANAAEQVTGMAGRAPKSTRSRTNTPLAKPLTQGTSSNLCNVLSA